MLSIKSAFRSYFPSKTAMNQTQDKLPSKTPIYQTQDKSTQTDFKSQRPRPPATSPPPLQRLPLELLRQIADNLPASSRLALRYTSNWFYGMYDPKTNVRLSNSVRDSREDRLEYLCFVERDAESPKHSYTCSLCVERHPADRFSAAELWKDPETRTCHRVWICEHRTMSLGNYRDLLTAPHDSSGVVMYPPSKKSTEEVKLYWNQCCPMARRWFSCTGNDNKKRLLSTTWSIPLRHLMAFGDALARGVNNEPPELDIFLCPHTNLLYQTASLLTYDIEASVTKKPVRNMYCPICKARFWGSFKDSSFEVRCDRFLGDGRTDDPDWSSQVRPVW